MFCAWDRMKAASRPISTSARNLFETILLDSYATSPTRRTLCKRCLHTLRNSNGNLQGIKRLPRARPDNGSPLVACSWHKEPRRRVSQTRSLATVREGMRLSAPRLAAASLASVQKLRRQTITDSRIAPKHHGPLDEYDERVHSRRLRDDEHQRCTPGCSQLKCIG